MIYKNKLSIFFTILSIIFLMIFFDKFGKYILLEKHIKLSLITFLFIFFFINIFLSNKIQKKCFFIFIYSVIIIYSLNLLLGLFYIFEDYKKTSLIKSKVTNFDNRNVMEYIKDESSAEKKIYPYLTPREILIKSKNKDFMFVSGLSEQYYAQCNEEGFWKIIRTDKNGFNNILSSSEYNILLAGDSFADGTCSVSEKEIGKQLTQKGFDTYSIGFAGNGPLLTLASIIEIKNYIKFKNLVWFIYRNDFLDLKWELTDQRLTKYLESDFGGYGVMQNKKRIDIDYINFLNSKKGKNKKKFSYKENFFELKLIQKLYSSIYSSTRSSEIDSKIFVSLFKILDQKNVIDKNNILIVYLPGYLCFQKEKDTCIDEFNKIEFASDANRLKSINFIDYVNNKNINFKKLFKFEMPGTHYSNYGYEVLSNFVVEELIKKGTN